MTCSFAFAKKYRSLPAELKATIWFFICNVLQKGIQYITLPFYSRILSVQEYGDYVVFISWLSVISVFATLNLSAGMYMTGMARYEDERDKFSANMIGLSITFTTLIFILYFAFYLPLTHLIDLNVKYIIIIFVHCFFSPIFLFWSAHERFELRYKALAVVTILGTLVSPVLSFLLVFNMQDKALAISIGYISGQVCMGIFCGIKQLQKNSQLFNKAIWLEALAFNIPLIPHYLSYVILGQADRVMIRNICGQYDAGIYGFAYQISNAMTMLTSALDSAFSPQIYMEIKNQKNMIAKKINGVLMLYVAVAVMVSLVAPEIVIALGSDKYIEAKWVMPSIILSSYFLFLAGLFMKVEFFYKKSTYITVASTTIGILNILLNIIYIQQYGYIAAAYTTLFCYACFAFVHCFFMKKVIKKFNLNTTVYDMKTIFIISVVIFILLFGSLLTYHMFFGVRYLIVIVLIITVLTNKNKITSLLMNEREY